MMDKEAIIIGGGSTGLATGYHLAKKGLKQVTILEQNYVGSGSTGRCGTGIRAQFADKPTINMMKCAESGWNSLANKLGFAFHRTGYLYLHYTKEELNQYREMRKLQNSLGVPTESLSPREAKKICPLIDIGELKGASYNPEDGKAHPFEVVTSFKQYFRSGHVDLREGTKVTGIELNRKGKEKVIHTEDGTFRTEVLINAAGGWAAEVSSLMGIDLSIEPYRHQAVITEPVKAGTIEPMVISMEHEDAYLTQTERGGIIGGVATPPDEPSTYDMTETLEFEERVGRAFTSIAPALKSARILRHWAGYYAMTPDGNPLLGEYELPGYYLAAGFSGHGYMMAPAVGQGLAELIVDGKTDLPFDYYDPERIDRGELREGALQMG